MVRSLRLLTGLHLLLGATFVWRARSAPSRRDEDGVGMDPTPVVWPLRCTHQKATDKTQLYGTILHQAKVARNATDLLILRYLNERFYSSVYPQDHMSLLVKGVPQVPKRTKATINAISSMDDSRQWVATCIAFVDQTRIDESVEEEEYGNSFLSDTLELIDHYYDLFCSLESGLDQPTVKQLPFPSMLEKYRVSESVAMRHLRDYLVLRDCLKVVGETSRNFRVLQRRMAMGSNSP